MDGMPVWTATAYDFFAGAKLRNDYYRENPGFTFEAFNTGDSLWITASWKGSRRLAFRAAYAPGCGLQLEGVKERSDHVIFRLKTLFGDYGVRLEFPSAEPSMIRCTTVLTASKPLYIPFWPRDCVVLPGKKDPAGKVHVSQTGLRSGLVYTSFSQPANGSLLYFQNLTSLNDYCNATGTSLADTVGGRWPELGFALPPANERPLPAGKEIVLSDAYLLFDTRKPAGEFEMARQFLDMLSRIYVQLPPVETTYRNWPDILQKSLHDLKHKPGCWAQVNGHTYLNAYVSDYATPPESMVQMAVLLPLMDYEEWSGKKLEMTETIRKNLPEFYDEKIKSLTRWLVKVEEKLDGSEEHKKPRVMDSWYLHHPLLNLSRMAMKGDKTARKLLIGSLDYVIKVARHFKYDWPVFYNVDTLEVIKAETAEGKGGEKDVPGIYAHVMLQAYELTNEQKYLTEAKRAAKALQGRGFGIFYQANNTAFASGAMLRLWKITGDELYLNLSYLCLANIFKNIWLWDCDYGHAKHYQTFFALFSLNDAPYTAVYEELEGFSAFHDYLSHAKELDILPAVNLLLAEFIKHMMHRSLFYYPPQLPPSVLSEDVKSGELDKNLWIPVEDLQDGWNVSGTVGQEVYGAGLPFAIVPRHYYKIPEASMMVYIDYPTCNYRKRNQGLSFTIQGDERLHCRLMLIPLDKAPLKECSVFVAGKEVKGTRTPEGYLEYILNGDQRVQVKWKVENKRRKASAQLIKSL
jgi:hypothetical protein